MVWLSASSAAQYVDVHPDTIARRAIIWNDLIVPGKIRYMLLKLADDSRAERRYFSADLDALLISTPAACPDNTDCAVAAEQLARTGGSFGHGFHGAARGLSLKDVDTSGDFYQESSRRVYAWLSLGRAADYLDLHPGTILRRAHPWVDDPVRYRIRWRYFLLGDSKRHDRRYWVEDLEALLALPCHATSSSARPTK